MARLENYQYLNIIYDHIDRDISKIFSGELIFPRQLEVHLPGDGKTPCNFGCFYCQGGTLEQGLGKWEEKGLRIVEQLKGRIPYFIYGGAYTEPLMNQYFPDYLKLTKKYGNNFGIHSNGSLFADLEQKNGLCSLINNIATSSLDYVSFSLDAGSIESHCKIKNVKEDWFTKITEGIKILSKIRGNKDYPAIRVCYLMNKFNSSEDEIKNIITMMKELKVDSLRFSVPYFLYGKSFDKVKKYRNSHEIPFGKKAELLLKPYLSNDFSEKPYIFYHPPEFQDVDKMVFKQCIYSYYQITFAADGWIYKCSSTASPTFKFARLGEITDDFEKFKEMVIKNHDPDYNARTCFNNGARCNRIALEINDAWNNGGLGDNSTRLHEEEQLAKKSSSN
jgi:pyruvate-formate lyase-activating enzyme